MKVSGRAVLVVGLAFALAVAGSSSASAAASARWEMNEPAGAITMVDSGGAGLNGVVGTEVRTGVAVSGAVVYRFPWVSGLGTAYRPQRLVTVADNPYLDVTGASYQVSLRLKTKQTYVNVIQKGQSGNSGGYWKIELDNGYPNCLFRGPNGSLTVTSSVRVSDNAWHTVSCNHSTQGLQVVVDGVAGNLRAGSTGQINNNRPVAIGGKVNCDGVTAKCDYLSGDVDRVEIVKS
jgi:hypothetical protein